MVDGFSGVTIRIHNDPNAPWSKASVADNAVTLLHELGHAFKRINGAGGSFIQDDGAEGVSAFNTKIVKESCFR